MKTKFLIIVIILIGLGGGFLINRLAYPSVSIELPPTEKIHIFSVFYRDHMMARKVGPLPISLPPDRGSIEKDMKTIKEAGFQGIELEFIYGEGFVYQKTNKLTSFVAKKAAQESLYTLGLLSGHQQKPRERAFDKAELEKWENFVAKTVREHKTTIYFWQVWGEPEIEHFRYGTPEEYLELLKISYQTIKKENPEAKVVASLANNAWDFEFLKNILSLGGANYFDILAFHPYSSRPYWIRAEALKEAIKKIKQIQSEYGNQAPLWITEIGQPSFGEISEEKQAELFEFLLREAILNQIPVSWFHWSDRVPASGIYGWGLVRGDGSPKPALEKFKAIIKELNTR